MRAIVVTLRATVVTLVTLISACLRFIGARHMVTDIAFNLANFVYVPRAAASAPASMEKSATGRRCSMSGADLTSGERPT